MPLHILHHKSWHPGNLPAREKVLKDEAIRDANIAEIKARATKAEAESRLLSLRRAAGFHQDPPSSLPLVVTSSLSSLITTSSSGLPTTATTTTTSSSSRKSSKTTTEAANNLLGATIGQIPWYARRESLPMVVSGSNGGGGGAGSGSGGNGEKINIRDEKRKYLLDPLIKMKADRDHSSNSGSGSGSGSGISLKRKRDVQVGRASLLPLTAVSSSVRASPSTSSLIPGSIDWDKLRRERLAREAIEGARATRQLMDAAWTGEIIQTKNTTTTISENHSASTVAFASVAASHSADCRAFDKKGRRW